MSALPAASGVISPEIASAATPITRCPDRTAAEPGVFLPAPSPAPFPAMEVKSRPGHLHSEVDALLNNLLQQKAFLKNR